MSNKLTVEGNTIIDAVIAKINGAFPDVDVYDEKINEGCEYPYFMVMVEDFSEEKLMRENYLQTFIISVLYQYKEIPETSYSEFNPVSYKLTEALRMIELPNGDKLRGYNINSYPDNEKLEFYVNYDIKVATELKEKPKQMRNSVNILHKTRR